MVYRTPLGAIYHLTLLETHCLHADFEPGPTIDAVKEEVSRMRELLAQYVPTGGK